MSFFLKTLKTSVIISTAVLSVFLSETRTEGFRTSKIKLKNQAAIPFKIENIKEHDISKACDILNQNFTYLGRGRQYFVFESADEKYVIKFLNKDNFSCPPLLKKLSFIKPIDKIVKRKEKKYYLTFSSMKLSFENLKKESKLIFINLNKDIKLTKTLKIKNKCGSEFFIDLNNTIFILQKKITPFFTHLESIYEQEGQAGLEQALDEYLKFILFRCSLNIADDDVTVGDNMGFYKNKPVLIDNGRLYFDDSLQNRRPMIEEMLRSTKHLRKWLLINHPDQASFLNKKILQKDSVP